MRTEEEYRDSLTLSSTFGLVRTNVRALSRAGNRQQFERAFDRMLELDLTIADPRWRKARCLKEIVRLREVLCDLFQGDNIYQTSFDYLRRYFLEFGMAARLNR
jgi:hypothetical protein